jgi:hypothetical protein
MIRIKCYNVPDFLIRYLQKRNLSFVSERENILHYGGNDIKELKSIIKRDHPDLVITHKLPVFGSLNIFQVFHPLDSQADMDKTQKIYTNQKTLCQTYYRKLGIQAEIIFIKPTWLKPPRKFKNNFRESLVPILQRIKEQMNWA